VALSWSPDGKRIVIISPGPNAATASCQAPLYVVPTAGGPARSLHTSAGCDVAWSPRGDLIAYDRGGGIFVIRPDGSGRRQVATGGGPQWSADGTQLAFGVPIHRREGFTDRYTAFGVVDSDGSHFHVVTTHAYTEYPVAWSPQGRRIVYGRADHKGIYVIDPDSRNNHQLTGDSPPQADWSAMAWSPTGGSIVYDSGSPDITHLYVIGTDGRDKVQLTNTPDIEIDPTWVVG
jgi:Tol biopolymer transport system component